MCSCEYNNSVEKRRNISNSTRKIAEQVTFRINRHVTDCKEYYKSVRELNVVSTL